MSKVELAGLDGLIERLTAEHGRNGGQGAYAWVARELCGKAAAKIEALRDCARELAGFAGHKSQCPASIPVGISSRAKIDTTCTCGLDEALARFREALKETQS